MPAIISKEDVFDVIDLLEHKRLVHVFCRLSDSLPAISRIAAQFVASREAKNGEGRYEWRAFVVSPYFRDAVAVVKGVKKHIGDTPGLTHWDAAIKGRHGALRALVADPISLQGIAGDNLFYILLGNHNDKVWAAMWPSIAADTRVLAVNSELFSDRSSFAYVDWGE